VLPALGLNPGQPFAGPSTTPSLTLGGVLSAVSQADIYEQERRAAELAQNQPLITSLASYLRTCWQAARQAKEQTVEQRMFASVRARRGEYEPQRLAAIREQGGSEIYMMLTSVKCRGAGSWLRDVMLGSGTDKPWTIRPTPKPTLPPDVIEELRQNATAQLAGVIEATGQPLPPTELRAFLQELREEYQHRLYEEAKGRAELMETAMEDQLVEGGFVRALDQFIDDLTTFPAAFLKGPIVRRKPTMKWAERPGASGQFDLQIADELVLEWERVDPFMMYPSPASTGIDDGYLIERHKMRRTDLEALIGVDGYDDGAIRMVLDAYGRGGLQEWLIVDSAKADAEGRSTSDVMNNAEGLIDALQFWGSVSGTMLRDWGLSEEEVPDTAKQYNCEVWLIGSYVIKASLNYHPLGKKSYYKASYEDIPGAFWGNSVADLVRDCQDMCNSAARALANNMGIASGPMVSVNVERVPTGEKITNIYPWKVFQTTSDPMGSTAKPVEFFQATSNAQELMLIFEKFSVLADEYSGIPRYMTGDAPTGGAGRTASGMSMLMGNANKSMKQVVGNVDVNVLTPLLERLYFHNMRYSDDETLKGDVQIVARGANSIIAKESAQVRRNEFLAATANPIDLEIVGTQGRAALLREASKGLDMDPDQVVPPPAKLRIAARIAQFQAQMAAANPQPMAAPAAPAQGGQPTPANPTQNRQMLANGAPVADNFSPT